MKPPDTAERSPAGSRRSAQDATNVKAIVAAAAGVRRRRAVSWRLPPLASGRPDPLDALAGLPVLDGTGCCRGMFGAGGRWVPCCERGVA
jgi:hypothetical protein